MIEELSTIVRDTCPLGAERRGATCDLLIPTTRKDLIPQICSTIAPAIGKNFSLTVLPFTYPLRRDFRYKRVALIGHVRAI